MPPSQGESSPQAKRAESRRLDCSPGWTCLCVTHSGPRQAPGSPRTTWNRGRPETPPNPSASYPRTPESAPTAAALTLGTSEVPTHEAHQVTNSHPGGAAPVRRGACTRREWAPGPGTARRPPTGEWLRGRDAGPREKGYGGCPGIGERGTSRVRGPGEGGCGARFQGPVAGTGDGARTAGDEPCGSQGRVAVAGPGERAAGPRPRSPSRPSPAAHP